MKILCFGIAKEIVGADEHMINAAEITTVDELKAHLLLEFPELKSISSFMIAVNEEYGEGLQKISASDELAIIPPVSGG